MIDFILAKDMTYIDLDGKQKVFEDGITSNSFGDREHVIKLDDGRVINLEHVTKITSNSETGQVYLYLANVIFLMMPYEKFLQIPNSKFPEEVLSDKLFIELKHGEF